MTARFCFRLILTVVAALVFRLTLGARIAIAGVQPDLVAAIVFYLTLARGPIFGIISGVALGLLVDVDRPAAMGVSSLCWSTLAYLTNRLSEAVDNTDPIVSSTFLSLVVLAAETVRALFTSASNLAGFPFVWVRWALPTAAYTGVAAPLISAFCRWVFATPGWFRGRS